MEILKQITEDLKSAMKAQDKVALQALRGIKKEVLEAQTAKGSVGEVSEDQLIKILQKMVKQRTESAEIYEKQNRPDLAENENAESEIIKRYLPKQLDENELIPIIKDIIAKTGASTAADMGKVMGVASKELAGKADGKTISGVVRKLLC